MQKSTVTLLIITLVALGAQGCATTGESAAMMGAIGAAIGAAIGEQSGNAAQGAAIGGALGLATGAIAHDVNTRRGPQVAIEHIGVSPQAVRPGDTVTGEMIYAVATGSGGIPVQEQFFLTKDGVVVETISDRGITRSRGTFRRTFTLQVPQRADQGVYRVVGIVVANGIAYTGHRDFSVARGHQNPVRNTHPTTRQHAHRR